MYVYIYIYIAAHIMAWEKLTSNKLRIKHVDSQIYDYSNKTYICNLDCKPKQAGFGCSPELGDPFQRHFPQQMETHWLS